MRLKMKRTTHKGCSLVSKSGSLYGSHRGVSYNSELFYVQTSLGPIRRHKPHSILNKESLTRDWRNEGLTGKK